MTESQDRGQPTLWASGDAEQVNPADSAGDSKPSSARTENEPSPAKAESLWEQVFFAPLRKTMQRV